jgi:hypothetical protein
MCVSRCAPGELQVRCRVVDRKWRDCEGYRSVRTLTCSRWAPRSDGQSRAEQRQRVRGQERQSAKGNQGTAHAATTRNPMQLLRSAGPPQV